MNSREKILAGVRQNKPVVSALPQVPDFTNKLENIVAIFRNSVETGGGNIIAYSGLQDYIRSSFPGAKNIASCVDDFPGNIDLSAIQQPSTLENTDIAIIPAQWAVAENGAVWVTEKDCIYRVLPFITQYLIVIIDPQNIVQNMHAAYAKIKVNETGFGVFIAGPSKTADIEQSLVIGAQGARSFTVAMM